MKAERRQIANVTGKKPNILLQSYDCSFQVITTVERTDYSNNSTDLSHEEDNKLNAEVGSHLDM